MHTCRPHRISTSCPPSDLHYCTGRDRLGPNNLRYCTLTDSAALQPSGAARPPSDLHKCTETDCSRVARPPRPATCTNAQILTAAKRRGFFQWMPECVRHLVQKIHPRRSHRLSPRTGRRGWCCRRCCLSPAPPARARCWSPDRGRSAARVGLWAGPRLALTTPPLSLSRLPDQAPALDDTLMAGWVRELTTPRLIPCLPVIIRASEEYLVKCNLGFIRN